MASDGERGQPDRRSRQPLGAEGLSFGAGGRDPDRMGPMGDVAGDGGYSGPPGSEEKRPLSREEEALQRSWQEYQRAMKDREVIISSRPRTQAMTAEQANWVKDVASHPVLP